MSKATAKLRAAALERAAGFCECGCTRFLGEDAQMDHQAGRARVPQKLSNVWMLTAKCHEEKTLSKPDAATWLERYIKHCSRWGYATEKARAESRLVFVVTRAQLGASL